jgi:hypothetical protein
MPPENALTRFLQSYSRARNDAQRLQAIRRFREQPEDAAAEVESEVVLAVLVPLLRRLSRDGPEARAAAAELLRELWRRTAHTVAEETFAGFTLRLLKTSVLLHPEERAGLLAAIADGCAAAQPAVVGRLCLDLVARETERCLSSLPGGLLAPPPPPGFDVLRFIARCAPADVWPRLVRDLWRLYNLDTDPVGQLTLTELLSLDRSEAGLRRRRARHGATFGGSFGPVLRRDRDGQPVSVEVCWDTARRMLLRTLAESRPEDLGGAAPGFFAWLEDLACMPDEELQPLLGPLRGWAVAAMIPVLERWRHVPTLRASFFGAPTPSPAFRKEVSDVLAEIRASLGLGPEVVPAAAPRGGVSEPAPFPSPTGNGDEAAPAKRGGC